MNKKKIFKILLIMFISLLIFILVSISTFFLFLEKKLNKINYIELKPEDITVNDGVQEQISEYRNIVLLGIDTREDTYSGSRSDGIMIISINKKTHDVKVVSVYRDTYLDIRKTGATDFYLDKITHAYAFGNAQLALNSLNRNLDLNILEFVTVNFSAVVETVDAVGGIDLNIEADEIQHLNGYIDQVETTTGKKSTRITSAGIHHLDGVQALAYCRIRATEGGDYKRTERMRTVLISTFEKAKTLNVGELNNLVDTILPHISTNIQKQEIYQIMSQILKYHVKENRGWPYDIKGSMINGVWYGIPVNLENDVSKLHYDLFGTEDYKPSETVKNISDEIINKIN